MSDSREIQHEISSDVWLVLTATVDVRGITFMERNDPQLRLNDYVTALRLWLGDPGTPNIIVCENSAYDLKNLRTLVQQFNPHSKRVLFLSFDGQWFSRELGKGYGELLTLAHVIDNSNVLSPTSKLLKVNGRYYIRNIRKFADYLGNNSQLDVMCDLSRALTWADSRCFGASVGFMKEYLLPLQSQLNDSKGMYLEHVLARAVHMALNAGRSWRPLPTAPALVGVSGTLGTVYKDNAIRSLINSAYYHLKRYILLR